MKFGVYTKYSDYRITSVWPLIMLESLRRKICLVYTTLQTHPYFDLERRLSTLKEKEKNQEGKTFPRYWTPWES